MRINEIFSDQDIMQNVIDFTIEIKFKLFDQIYLMNNYYMKHIESIGNGE